MNSKPSNAKTENNKLTAIIVVIIFVAIASVIAIFYFNNQNNSSKKSITESKVDAENKKNYIENQNQNNSNIPKSSNITISAKTEADGSVTITSQIKNVSDGKCLLNISNNSGESHSKEADIIYQSEYSTCAGFSVDKSQVSDGTWTISVTATPLSGEPTTSSISFEVSR